MKYAALILLLLGFHAEAKIVDNAKAIQTYRNQLEETKRIFQDTQQTLIDSTPVFEMYQALGYTTPEVIAISKRYLALEERTKKLYGENLILNPTPFNYCATLPSVAYSLWMQRIDSVKKDNASTVNSLAQSYIKQGKECVDSIKNPPPEHLEESDDVQIIDIEN